MLTKRNTSGEESRVNSFDPEVADYAKGKSPGEHSDWAPKGTERPEGNSAGSGQNTDLNDPFGAGVGTSLAAKTTVKDTPGVSKGLVHGPNPYNQAHQQALGIPERPVWKKAGQG
jgi:hypothetical protein